MFDVEFFKGKRAYNRNDFDFEEVKKTTEKVMKKITKEVMQRITERYLNYNCFNNINRQKNELFRKKRKKL